MAYVFWMNLRVRVPSLAVEQKRFRLCESLVELKSYVKKVSEEAWQYSWFVGTISWRT